MMSMYCALINRHGHSLCYTQPIGYCRPRCHGSPYRHQPTCRSGTTNPSASETIPCGPESISFSNHSSSTNTSTALEELGQYVHGKVPHHVYALHYLIEKFVALEAGFTAGLIHSPPGRQRNGNGRLNEEFKDSMQTLVNMKCTDAEIGAVYDENQRTIARWRGAIGILKRPLLHSTPDAVLQQVSSPAI